MGASVGDMLGFEVKGECDGESVGLLCVGKKDGFIVGGFVGKCVGLEKEGV